MRFETVPVEYSVLHIATQMIDCLFNLSVRLLSLYECSVEWRGNDEGRWLGKDVEGHGCGHLLSHTRKYSDREKSISNFGRIWTSLAFVNMKKEFLG
jgi:hypothetical protein